MNRRVHLTLVALLLLTAAGCGSAAPPATPAPSVGAAQPPSASPTGAPAPSFTPAARPAPPKVEASDVSTYALLQAGDVDSATSSRIPTPTRPARTPTGSSPTSGVPGTRA